MEKADDEQQTSINTSAVKAALDKLKQHPEPEAAFMDTGRHIVMTRSGRELGSYAIDSFLPYGCTTAVTDTSTPLLPGYAVKLTSIFLV